MRNVNWMKHKLESRLPAEISITSDMQMTPPYGRKRRRIKKTHDESEEESGVVALNIKKTKIMASGPITSWENSGNSGRLYFGGL